MTLRSIHQQIGRIDQAAAKLAQQLELTDRMAECHGNPQQPLAQIEAAAIRSELSHLYTRRHQLEALIPTPETLSVAAFNRALALGLGIEAAEANRTRTLRDAHQRQALPFLTALAA